MSFLRLGTYCAVIDVNGHILLSKRGDFKQWALPGGRLDYGEQFEKATIREIYEETGVQIDTPVPVGLYYWPNWQRLNMLFKARPLNNNIKQQTSETLANRYFAPTQLPQNILSPQYVNDALTANFFRTQTIELDPLEYQKSRILLGMRWMKNLLSGHPEPKFPHFTVYAVAAIFDEDHRYVLTTSQTAVPALPRVLCDGTLAPWDQLTTTIQSIHPLSASLHWVGLFEDTLNDTIEFVFAGTTSDATIHQNTHDSTTWTAIQNTALKEQDAAYLQRIQMDYVRQPVWTMTPKHKYIVTI